MTNQTERIDLRFNVILFSFIVIIGVLGYLGFTSIRAELLDEQVGILEAKTNAVGI